MASAAHRTRQIFPAKKQRNPCRHRRQDARARRKRGGAAVEEAGDKSGSLQTHRASRRRLLFQSQRTSLSAGEASSRRRRMACCALNPSSAPSLRTRVLRGVMDAFGFINRGVRAKAGTYNDFDRPMVQFSDALAAILAGKPAFFSWSTLLSGQPPDPQRLTRFHYDSAGPRLYGPPAGQGAVAISFARAPRISASLPENGVTVRLTGRRSARGR